MEDSGSGSGTKDKLSLSQRAFVGIGMLASGGSFLFVSLIETDALHLYWQELTSLRPLWLLDQVGIGATSTIVWGAEGLAVIFVGWVLRKVVLPKLLKPFEYLGKAVVAFAVISSLVKYGIPFVGGRAPCIPPLIEKHLASHASAVAAAGSLATIIALVLYKLKKRFNASFTFALLLFAFGMLDVSEKTHSQVMRPFSAAELSLYMVTICIVSMSLLHHLAEIQDLRRAKVYARSSLRLD